MIVEVHESLKRTGKSRQSLIQVKVVPFDPTKVFTERYMEARV